MLGAVTRVGVTEVPDVEALPVGAGGLLIVGRQHRTAAGTLRYGYEVLEDAVERLQPDALVYVLPSEYDSLRYAVDFATLERVREITPTYVLEFPCLQSMTLTIAVEQARVALAEPTNGHVAWLLRRLDSTGG